MNKKEFREHRMSMKHQTVSYRLAEQINKNLGLKQELQFPGINKEVALLQLLIVF